MTFSWHDILLMVIPFLISLIVKPDWDPKIKYGITMLFCALASAIEFYFAVWLTGSVQATFLEAFSKSFLVIFATYAAVLKFPIPGQTIADRLEETGGVSLPAEVTAVLKAKTAADKRAAEAEQAAGEAVKAREVVAEAKVEAAAVAEDK